MAVDAERSSHEAQLSQLRTALERSTAQLAALSHAQRRAQTGPPHTMTVHASPGWPSSPIPTLELTTSHSKPHESAALAYSALTGMPPPETHATNLSREAIEDRIRTNEIAEDVIRHAEHAMAAVQAKEESLTTLAEERASREAWAASVRSQELDEASATF